MENETARPDIILDSCRWDWFLCCHNFCKYSIYYFSWLQCGISQMQITDKYKRHIWGYILNKEMKMSSYLTFVFLTDYYLHRLHWIFVSLSPFSSSLSCNMTNLKLTIGKAYQWNIVSPQIFCLHLHTIYTYVLPIICCLPFFSFWFFLCSLIYICISKIRRIKKNCWLKNKKK